jgi:hypothetical protein
MWWRTKEHLQRNRYSREPFSHGKSACTSIMMLKRQSATARPERPGTELAPKRATTVKVGAEYALTALVIRGTEEQSFGVPKSNFILCLVLTSRHRAPAQSFPSLSLLFNTSSRMSESNLPYQGSYEGSVMSSSTAGSRLSLDFTGKYLPGTVSDTELTTSAPLFVDRHPRRCLRHDSARPSRSRCTWISLFYRRPVGGIVYSDVPRCTPKQCVVLSVPDFACCNAQAYRGV